MFPRLKNMSFKDALVVFFAAVPVYILGMVFLITPIYLGFNLFCTLIGFITFNFQGLYVALEAEKKALKKMFDDFFFKITHMEVIGDLGDTEDFILHGRWKPNQKVLAFVRVIDYDKLKQLPPSFHGIALAQASLSRKHPFVIALDGNNKVLDKRMGGAIVRSLAGDLKDMNLELLGVRHLRTGEYRSV